MGAQRHEADCSHAVLLLRELYLPVLAALVRPLFMPSDFTPQFSRWNSDWMYLQLLEDPPVKMT